MYVQFKSSKELKFWSVKEIELVTLANICMYVNEKTASDIKKRIANGT